MTESMESRYETEENELVEVRIWVKKKDEKFIEHVARLIEQKRQGKPKEELSYFGQCAPDALILFAKELAKANDIPEPEDLYDYHVSLGGWILNVITHLSSGYNITKTE
jgi:hypothetical protein